MERETFDFFGIIFEGHPNLKRILNVEDMVDFPLRKEFPLEDQTREDKDDSLFGRWSDINYELWVMSYEFGKILELNAHLEYQIFWPRRGQKFIAEITYRQWQKELIPIIGTKT